MLTIQQATRIVDEFPFIEIDGLPGITLVHDALTGHFNGHSSITFFDLDDASGGVDVPDIGVDDALHRCREAWQEPMGSRLTFSTEEGFFIGIHPLVGDAPVDPCDESDDKWYILMGLTEIPDAIAVQLLRAGMELDAAVKAREMIDRRRSR